MGKIKYVDEPNLQVAMSEYDTGITKDYELYDQYDNPIGTVTLDFDNENGNGEQVYAVVKDPNLPKDHV
ncbi:TPA: triacylglycerol lipase, partial [Streptococcus suis]|nr:triacylglycerol lipase [Streptococcus suis]HEM3447920.1 triacylglycerol lipase [Streptococcus suis]HEM3503952.1 triacylglycerol lipase [Streptococcus suis]HEM3515109.1 triacylglycerol lipase [Streptococcus suis]HEM3531758.1 triacylglycerol lipase [Streptococcus suis]